jgi:hypothetical protein
MTALLPEIWGHEVAVADNFVRRHDNKAGTGVPCLALRDLGYRRTATIALAPLTRPQLEKGGGLELMIDSQA